MLLQVAIVGFTFLTLINGFDVFWPANWSASSFLTSYVGIPIFFCIYFAHRIYARRDPWAHNAVDVDLHTGLEDVIAGEAPAKTYDKWWKKIQMIWE